MVSCLGVWQALAHHAVMTHDKFQTLCEKVIVPRIAGLIEHQIVELSDTLEMIAGGLARIERKIDEAIDNRSVE